MKFSSWKWSPFNYVRAYLFQPKEIVFKNIYFALCNAAKLVATLDSSSWSRPNSSSTDKDSKEDLIEIAINKAITSKRLSFEPGNNTSSSILDHEANNKLPPFPECVALALVSEDPYADFRVSMEQTVETCGLKHWEDLEELLGWYLKVNREQYHCFIIDAFVDLFSASGTAPFPCFSCPISHPKASSSSSSSKSEIGG